MKNLLLPLCLFFLTTLQAQVSFGLKAGYVKAWEKYGDIGLPDDAKIHINGFQLSGIVEMPLTKLLSINIEPGYVRRGAACFPGWVNSTRDTRFKFGYAELPVMLKAHKSIFHDRFEVFGKAGYGISYMLAATREFLWFDSGEREPTKLNFKDEEWINRLDHGIYAGVGVSMKLGSNRLVAEVSHYHGLIDTDRNNTTKNRSLQYTLGYRMML